MSDLRDKAKGLMLTSQSVLEAYCLDNGAIIAADTDHPTYPVDGSDYRFVWPRDAAFTLYALHQLGVDKSEAYCQWLLARAESFHDAGFRFRRYATNGATSWTESSYQPDQAGATLWALAEINNQSEAVRRVVQHTADLLVRSWHENHFDGLIHDLWEHVIYEHDDTAFSYSLAACARGLQLAAEHYDGPEEWRNAAAEMSVTLAHSHSNNHFSRLAHQDDGNLDASLCALVWPFRVTSHERQLKQTLKKLRQELYCPLGMRRFANDTYDGLLRRGLDENGGAGPWPLLSLWYAIALYELGQKDEAVEAYEAVLRVVPDDYLPEQLFDDERVGITPLAWSHAMFIIATKRLRYL